MGDETRQADDRPGDPGGEPRGDQGGDQGGGPQGDRSSTPRGDEAPAAIKVIGAFGGIRPMAGKLDVPVSTVQGWKERGVIPEARHQEILAAAAAHGIALDAADLAASAEGPPPDPAGEPASDSPRESAPGSVPGSAGPGTGPGTGTGAGAGPGTGGAADKATNRAARDDRTSAVPPAAAAAHQAAHQNARQNAKSGGRSGWVGGFVLGALVFAVGAGGAVLTRDLWAPAGAPAEGDALAGKLSDLESRLAEVEARPAAPELPKDLATADDIARLEGQIASLGAAGDTEDLAAEVQDLKARVTSMDSNVSAGAEAASALGGLSGEVKDLAAAQKDMQAAIDALKSRDAGAEAVLWSAVGALRDALRYAGPFSDQLADVNRLAGDRAGVREALAELEPLADTGVASLAELQRTFPAAARDMVAAGYGDGNDGVLGDVLNRVSQVVTVRPVGEVEGDSTGAIVARAEGHLDRGDLAAAHAELEALPEDAKAAAAGWRERAERRLAADAAIARLNGLLAEQMAAGD